MGSETADTQQEAKGQTHWDLLRRGDHDHLTLPAWCGPRERSQQKAVRPDPLRVNPVSQGRDPSIAGAAALFSTWVTFAAGWAAVYQAMVLVLAGCQSGSRGS